MITTTSRKPSSIAVPRLWIESSMNVAGRKIVVSKCMPGRPGSIDLRAASTPWVTLRVLPHGSFSTTSSSPGRPSITASPMIGW